MAKLEKTLIINAPVEKVFGYMTEPANLPEIWPSMVEVKAVKKMPEHVGASFNWVYKMAGMRFEGSSQVTEWVANQREVTKSTRGIASTFTWKYKTENGGTKVTVEVEYTIPVPLLGKLAEAFIVKQNEHEAEGMLANLKARMEV
jgi:uncharacterized membrane protein